MALANQEAQESFHLPKIVAGVDGSLSEPEQNLLANGITLDQLKRIATDSNFQKNWQNLGVGPLTVVPTEGNRLVVSLRGTSNQSLAGHMNTYLAELHTAIKLVEAKLLIESLEKRLHTIDKLEIAANNSIVESSKVKLRTKLEAINSQRVLLAANLKQIEANNHRMEQRALEDSLNRYIKVKSTNDQQLKAMRLIAAKRRDDIIGRYVAAINTAKRLGIVEMSPEFAAKENNRSDTSPNLYLRGESNLRAALSVLKDTLTDSMLVPQIVSLEAGVAVISAQVDYDLKKAQRSHAADSGAMFELKAKLAALDNPGEQKALEELIHHPETSEVAIADKLRLGAERSRIKDLLAAVPQMDHLIYQKASADKILKTKDMRSILWVAGPFFGLVLGICAAVIIQGWRTRKKGAYQAHSALSPGLQHRVLQ